MNGVPGYGTFSYNTVDIYDTTFTSGSVTRVNVNPDTRRSWALVQAPAGSWTFFGKVYAVPTNVLVIARIKWLHYYQETGTNHDRSIALSLMGDNSGNPDINNKVVFFLNDYYNNTVRAAKYRTSGGTLYDYTSTTEAHEKGQALEYLAIQKLGTTYHFYVANASGNWIWMGSLVESTTMQHVGMLMETHSTDRPGVTCYAMDFIRFYETDNFLF